MVTGPAGEILIAPGKFTFTHCTTYEPGAKVMLSDGPLILRLSGLDEPSGRLVALAGTVSVGRVDDELWVCCPFIVPPLLIIEPAATMLPAVPTLLPPYTPALDEYESTFAPELTMTLPVVAVIASTSAVHGGVVDDVLPSAAASLLDTPELIDCVPVSEPQAASTARRSATLRSEFRRYFITIALSLRSHEHQTDMAFQANGAYH
jgi:hypothetical protein